MNYEITYHTDIGTTRKVNQDSAGIMVADTSNGPVCMALLCDGMGGIEMGEYASSYVVMTFMNWFEEELPKLLRSQCSLEQIGEQWKTLLIQQDCYLREYGETQKIKLGTTATCVLFWQGRYLLAQSGDSRLYEAGRRLRQISRDQSKVQEQIDLGILTKEEARVHPKRNVLSDCIGGSRPSVPVCTYGRLKRKANYFLCSDGLVHEVSEPEISQYTNGVNHTVKNDLHDKLVEMTEIVKKRGETDNITAVAVMPGKGARSGGICRSRKTDGEWLFHIRERVLLTEGSGSLTDAGRLTETEGDMEE